MTTRLPNSKNAYIDTRKLKDYCLNPHHPRGKHKAKVFESVLKLKSSDSQFLQDKILESVQLQDSERLEADEYGVRYLVDFEMEFNFHKAVIRTLWIIKNSEDFPRLTSCFVKSKIAQ